MQAGSRDRSPSPSLGLGQSLLPLEPQFRERVWGGQRLRASDPPIGEAWIAFGESVVATGPLAGRKLADLAAEHGPALAGFVGLRPLRPPLPAPGQAPRLRRLAVGPGPSQRRAGPAHGGSRASSARPRPGSSWKPTPDARILLGVKPGTATVRAGRPRSARGGSSRLPRRCRSTAARRCSFPRARCTRWAPGCSCMRSSRRATRHIAPTTGAGRSRPGASCTSRSPSR